MEMSYSQSHDLTVTPGPAGLFTAPASLTPDGATCRTVGVAHRAAAQSVMTPEVQ